MNTLQLSAKVAGLTLVLLLNTLKINAQGGEEGKVRLGITISPLVTWMDSKNESYESDGLRFGGRYGLFADFSMFGDQRYNLSTGLIVSNVGGKLEYPVGYLAGEPEEWRTTMARAKYGLTYLNLPLRIKLRTDQIGYSYYYGVFGAELGYNVSSTVHETVNENTVEDIDVEDDRYRFDGVEPFRVEMVIGGGMERIISGQTRLVVGVSYHNGLRDVLKGRDYELNDIGDVVRNPGTDSGALNRELRTSLNYFTLKVGISF